MNPWKEIPDGLHVPPKMKWWRYEEPYEDDEEREENDRKARAVKEEDLPF